MYLTPLPLRPLLSLHCPSFPSRPISPLALPPQSSHHLLVAKKNIPPPTVMDAIKKKMQAMKVEKDNACDRSDQSEEASKVNYDNLVVQSLVET